MEQEKHKIFMGEAS